MLVNALKYFVVAVVIAVAGGMTALAGETVESFDISEQENVSKERSRRLKAISEVLASMPQEVLTLRQAGQPEIDENFTVTFSLEYGVDMEKYATLCAKLFSALDAAGAVNLGKYSDGNDDIFKTTLIKFNDADDSGWLLEEEIQGLYSSFNAYGKRGEADTELLRTRELAAVCIRRGADRESVWKFYLLPQDVSKLFVSDLHTIQCKAVLGYEGADAAGDVLGSTVVSISQYKSSGHPLGFWRVHTISPGVWLDGNMRLSDAYAVGPGKSIMQYTVNLQAEELREMTGIRIELQRNRGSLLPK